MDPTRRLKSRLKPLKIDQKAWVEMFGAASVDLISPFQFARPQEPFIPREHAFSSAADFNP